MRHAVTLIFFLFFTSLGFTQDDYRETVTGLQFKFYNDVPGATGKIGDLASLHMIMKSDQGDVLRNSYTDKGGKPILFPIRYSSFDGDLYEAVSIMSIGDSATFLIPADSMYAHIFKKPLPEGVESGSDLNFTLKVLNIQSQKKRLNDLQVKQKEEQDNLKAQIDTERTKQDKAIETYLNNNGITNFIKTPSGLYYSISSPGEGEFIKKGQAPIFHYTGTLLDGEVFESSYDLKRPVVFTLGDEQVISGWEEAFEYMQLGSKAKVIVPSHLAYGHNAKGEKIKPFTVLVFDIDVINVK